MHRLTQAVLWNAKSAIHEIEAFVLFLIGAVFGVGGAVVQSVKRLHLSLLAVMEAKPSREEDARE